jgi:DNA-directed RNA polymerase specialized sigma24 family protein
LTDTKELEPEAAEGLNGLYRRYAGWLDGRLRAHVGADQAADVVQETYLRAAPYRSADIRHPKSFLLRIALNLVRDESRRLKRQHEALGDFGQEQSGAASQAEQLMLKQIILTMPPLYRDIFVLSRFRPAHPTGCHHIAQFRRLGSFPRPSRGQGARQPLG